MRTVGDLEVAFRANKPRMLYVTWTIAEGNHGDECSALRLVMVDKAKKKNSEHHFLGIRRHALARILLRTGITRSEELADALPLIWLYIFRFAGAQDGDRLTLPLQDGSMLAGGWSHNLQQGESMAVTHSCLMPELAHQDRWDRKHCRLALHLFDVEDAPVRPMLYGEEVAAEQKENVFLAAQAGRPK